jgi:hypothetical protein
MLLLVGPVLLVLQIPFRGTAALPKEIIHELEIICYESTIRDSVRLGAGPR